MDESNQAVSDCIELFSNELATDGQTGNVGVTRFRGWLSS
ncbi:hypothetical protein AWB76_07654 [Caballeronia temeraria]|uniref:Uncharacterized protein n=1 Tax=Caballeronia temeraria TaxID=1777137 RepID=A0A158DX02_9BURK|nr:hypothetical protein AWB76_07654 [Caballeronia temeraria]